ncbi:MAG: hypothetical protein HZB18_00290 [Chloroflexi bacterium]|nr:hypothetical protein [Chloroflexota bacterium]
MLKKQSRSFTVIFFFAVFFTISAVVFVFIALKKHTEVTIEKDYINDIVQHNNFSNQVHTDSLWGSPRGIGIGFVWPEERKTPPEYRSQTEEIDLGDKKSLDPLLILTTSRKTTVLVSVILDYQQIPFEMDGQIGLLHEVNILPGGDFEIPIRIPITSPGVHDLIVVAFADPYNGSLDANFRSALDVDVVGRRAQIISSGKSKPAIQGLEVIEGEPVPGDVALGLGVSFAAKPKPGETTHPSERQLYVSSGKTSELYQFDIWASNLNGEMASEYALLVFKNFHQINVDDRNVLLINLNQNEEAIINAEIKLSEKPGIDQIQIVYVFDPYKSILHEEVRAAFVFNSPRLAIEVR